MLQLKGKQHDMKYQKVWFKSIKENKSKYVMVPEGFMDRLSCFYIEAKSVYGFDLWMQVNNDIIDNKYITDTLSVTQQKICIEYAMHHIVWVEEEQS